MAQEKLDYIIPRGLTDFWKHLRSFQGITDVYLSVLFIDCTRGREIKTLVVQGPYKDLIIDNVETLHVLL